MKKFCLVYGFLLLISFVLFNLYEYLKIPKANDVRVEVVYFCNTEEATGSFIEIFNMAKANNNEPILSASILVDKNDACQTSYIEYQVLKVLEEVQGYLPSNDSYRKVLWYVMEADIVGYGFKYAIVAR